MAAAFVALALVLALVIFPMASPVGALSFNYYDHTCPQLESTVTSAVKKAMMNDKTVPAALLRMHFHDCFIRVYNCFTILFLKFLKVDSSFMQILTSLYIYC